MSTKIGILGSGDVAKALGRGFITHGYAVMLGTRDPQKLSEWKESSGGSTGTFAEAAAFGDIIVLAVKGSAANSVINLAGISNLDGKTVIDTTNPISDAPAVNGVLRFYTSLEESQLELLQKAYPAVHFVKAFSCTGNVFMVNPDFNGLKPTMFICGNNPGAKASVTKILDQFGWETEDMGASEAARAIEPLCILWCIPGFTKNQWMHAFKLLKK